MNISGFRPNEGFYDYNLERINAHISQSVVAHNSTTNVDGEVETEALEKTSKDVNRINELEVSVEISESNGNVSLTRINEGEVERKIENFEL